MEHRNYIISELESISPLVAGIAPVNPYQVPEGYFNDLAVNMLQLVQAETLSAVLARAVGVNPYSVPSDYFNNFPYKVLSLVKREELSQVLKNASSNPYEVPDNYFENLSSDILKRVKTQGLSAQEEIESISPLLSRLDKKVPFSTPEGYFDELTENTVAGTKAVDFVKDELELLSPLMRSLRKEQVYAIPAGYFEQLPAAILKRVTNQEPAKVVSMSFRKRVVRYAVAAVVTGIIVTAGLLFVNRNNSIAPDSMAQSEDKLKKEALSNVHTLSDEELINYIENQTVSLPDYLGASSQEIDSEDVKLMLADIPDSELKQYLVEYGDEEQILTN